MNDSKAKILQAAEELISEKGVARTTIAQIARKAGVSDSLAYQYFKDKEDLVFSVAYQRLEDTWKELQEQLQGIIDPRSELGRVIWFGLRYNELHQDYVRNLMFEYRSNKDFYKSPAYAFIRNHSQLTLQILHRGVDQGVFRNDVDMRLVREIIYGTQDFEAVDCAITRDISESSTDWQDLMSLILNMIEEKGQCEEPGKRERILVAAEEVFAEFGFAKAKLADIASLVGIAESSIYDFFESKEVLLLSITEMRLQGHMALLPETFHIKTPIRKLRRFIRYHFDLYMQNRNFLKIFVMDNLLSQKFYASKAFDEFKKYIKTLEDIVEEGKACGAFRHDVNTRVFKNMFLGAFTHMALRWIIFDEKNFDKMGEVKGLVELLCAAVTIADTCSSG
ncbi:TetR/AcrR family transcriptional regulator [Desulfomonile tiedjei]|uniref:Transcriptional regulator n=1 Tax=Desulfomonile tiedjei (strain ATCC 49306 / DSM 6799 / DCB-1) TaxID=706587 RepID=I4CEL0_DESTA|nr:TetR/AcrR family transcriptional regulator [Desulfomonile tiedjei]AFM28001.1 transcriptional regulator [Desulfomonile tiedjei DSM 6799]